MCSLVSLIIYSTASHPSVIILLPLTLIPHHFIGLRNLLKLGRTLVACNIGMVFFSQCKIGLFEVGGWGVRRDA